MANRMIRRESSCDRYVLGALASIELLMSFTPLGYLHIPPISITIGYLPILVGGCLLGPGEAVILGLVFGLASMFKATASYVLPADEVFSPFVSGAPLSSLVLSVGMRMLFGLAVGLAFLWAKDRKHRRLWFILISMASPKTHSLLVYTALWLLFPELGFRPASAFRWDLDDLIFSAACVLVVELVWALYRSGAVQDIRTSIDQSVHDPYAPNGSNWFFAAFEGFVLCMSVFAVGYFSNRESVMLQRHGVHVTQAIASDLLNLQTQFLIATLALNGLSLILLTATYRYMAYKKYRGEIDELTGVMGRRMFLYHCERVQKTAGPERTGWFLFVDADYFKQINDTYGHAVGDRVLRSIASNLRDVFGAAGAVGRLGGDEFAVIVEEPWTPEELSRGLEQFLAVLRDTLPEQSVSCSIGAYQFRFPREIQELLEETDGILYQAKEKGRACYVMQACAGR